MSNPTIQTMSAEALRKTDPHHFDMRKYLLDRGESHIFGKDGSVWREDPDGTITNLGTYDKVENEHTES